MNRKDLAVKLAELHDISIARADAILVSVFDSNAGLIVSSVKQGEDVTLLGFGSFSSAKRKARPGRNPKTGEAIKIAASVRPTFKAGSGFRDALNTRRKAPESRAK